MFSLLFFSSCFLFVSVIIVGFLFLFLFSFFLSILSALPSPSSHLYSHSLHSPSFSFPTTLSDPSQLLSPPFSPPPPFLLNLSPHYSPYTLTTCWPTYYTNFTQPQPPTIPDTSTLHYNRNTLKHTQGPQNPVAHTLLPSLTQPLPASQFSATLTNSQISIAILTNVNPSTPTA
jgi:hypothetical protein